MIKIVHHVILKISKPIQYIPSLLLVSTRLYLAILPCMEDDEHTESRKIWMKKRPQAWIWLMQTYSYIYKAVHEFIMN